MSSVDPNDVLFTTPTLNNALPALSDVLPAADCLRMHEDDWRQFEFVGPAHDAALASELAAIDRIWRESSVPLDEGMTGFREVHVRELIETPLDIAMSRTDFETLLGASSEPLALLDYPATCRDVYAIRLANVIVYATIKSDRLITLGLETDGRVTMTGEPADRFEKLVTEHSLRLVHWRSRTLFATPAAAMKYLRGGPIR